MATATCWLTGKLDDRVGLSSWIPVRGEVSVSFGDEETLVTVGMLAFSFGGWFLVPFVAGMAIENLTIRRVPKWLAVTLVAPPAAVLWLVLCACALIQWMGSDGLETGCGLSRRC